MIDEFEDQDEQPRRKSSRKKTRPVGKVRLSGRVLEVREDQDPDDILERYVAAGNHTILERSEPDVAKMITKRFIDHQAWLDSRGASRG